MLVEITRFLFTVDLWYYVNDKVAEDTRSLNLSDITDVKTSARLTREFINDRLPKETAFVSLVY